MSNKPYLLLNTNIYRFKINNRIIHIINYGERHYQAPKLDLSIYKNKKTCFYLEYPMRIFNKQIDFMYFNNLNPKTKKLPTKTYYLRSLSKNKSRLNSKFNSISTPRPKQRLHKKFSKNNSTKITPYDNRYHIAKYFGKWYLDNGYKFDDDSTIPEDLKDCMKSDLTIASKHKKYNKLWDLCPCDYRSNVFFYSFTGLISILQQYYLYILKSINSKNFCCSFRKYMFINFDVFMEEFITETPNTFEGFINPIKEEFERYKKYDVLPLNEITEQNQYKRIFGILDKYMNNENYQKIIKDPSTENITNYFKGLDLAQLTIDIFNVNTCFYFEEDLKKYPDIIEFIKFYYHQFEKSILYGPCDITSYDIILFINLNKNIEKYNYHVIYNGLFHFELFKYYMLFFEQKYEIMF